MAIKYLRLGGQEAALTALGFSVVGYVGGTFYSLSYLSKAVAAADWKGCIKPSAIAFALLALAGMMLIVQLQGQRDLFVWICAAVAYLAIVLAFWRITAIGFSRLAAETAGTPPSLAEREKRRQVRAAISAAVAAAFPGCTTDFCAAAEYAHVDAPTLGFRVRDPSGADRSGIVWVNLDEEEPWTAERILNTIALSGRNRETP
jgi:hypothetical protein